MAGVSFGLRLPAHWVTPPMRSSASGPLRQKGCSVDIPMRSSSFRVMACREMFPCSNTRENLPWRLLRKIDGALGGGTLVVLVGERTGIEEAKSGGKKNPGRAGVLWVTRRGRSADARFVSGGAACAMPWLRSGGYARG